MRAYPKAVVGILIAGALLAPALALALTKDELNAQIAAILAQVSQLQTKIAANAAATYATTTASAPVSAPTAVSATNNIVCPVFNFTLAHGARGAAVTALQSFLVTQGFLTADSATGFYGDLTQSAVQNFQTQQGIVSSGSVATTGWGNVGKRTSAAIAQVCSTPKSAAISIPVGCTAVAVPTTSCNGTWTVSLDSNKCVSAWQCVSTVQACTLQALLCPAGQHVVATGCTQSCVNDVAN